MRDDGPAPPWVRSLQDLMGVLPGLVSDRLELLALELQRAARSLVQILACVVASVLLLTAAWLVVCSGLGVALIGLGASWPLAMLAVLGLNVALAWVAIARARRLVADLGLPATRRHLVLGAGAGPAARLARGGHALRTQAEGRP